MSYYMRGDYYRGDYYRGDPGPFSFIEKGLKSVARAVVPGFSAGESLVRSLRPTRPVTQVTPAVQPPTSGMPTGGLIGGALTALDEAARRMGVPSSLISGTNRLFFGPGGELIVGRRRRRMNVLNPKALRRALRRAEGFEKIARRTVNALHRGPAKFKKQRRNRR